MDDISPKLLGAIEEDFNALVKDNKIITSLQKKILNKEATYEEANEYAIELGNVLAKAYKKNLSADILPDNRMYYNIAQKVIDPTMRNNYLLISKATCQVQKTLNEKAKINVKVQEPKLNEDRIRGIVQKVANSENYDDVAWVLDEPIINFSQSIVDDTIKANAEFHSKLGMEPKIIRKVVGNCCKWCRSLAGTYSYPNVPHDVYRRHQRCRCTVDYYPGDGKVQNVHTKEIRDIEQIEYRKTINVDTSLGKDVTAFYYGTASPKKGKITIPDDYKVNKHKEEIEVADLIFNTFGGDISLLNEAFESDIKMPDYSWNKKYWELKTTTTEKSADGAIRRAIKQIEEKPGGIILDYRNCNIDFSKLQKIIDDRMKRNYIEADIMILLKNNIKIFRYKK